MSIITKSILILILLLFYCPILGALGIIYSVFVYAWSRLLVSESSQYGDIKVTQTHIGHRILLMNDGVIHSVHRKHDAIPEGYCYGGSGVADVLQQCHIVSDDARVALIGLGAGALLHYARQGQHWHCYEINPSVVKLATNGDLFGFLTTCPAQVTILCEDGFSDIDHLRQLDVIIVDTFFADHNLGSQKVLATPINESAANTIFVLHVSGLSDQDISTIAQLGTFSGFSSIIKETPNRDNKPGRCPLSDFRHPFHMPAKWVLMSRNRCHIADLSVLPGWQDISGGVTLPMSELLPDQMRRTLHGALTPYRDCGALPYCKPVGKTVGCRRRRQRRK